MNVQVKHIFRLIIPIFLFLATINISAQKFGHLDSSELLASMAEWKDAERSIASLQEKLKNDYQAKLTDFQNQVTTLRGRVEQGQITQAEMQTEEQRLMGLEQTIAQFEIEAQQQVLQQEQTLLEPILDKAKNAIKMVAEENGYSYIFDSITSGTLLFTLPSENVLELVKSKL